MPLVTVKAAKLQALTAEFSGLVTMRTAHETIDAAEQTHKDMMRLQWVTTVATVAIVIVTLLNIWLKSSPRESRTTR